MSRLPYRRLTLIVPLLVVVIVPLNNPKWFGRMQQLWHHMTPSTQNGVQQSLGTPVPKRSDSTTLFGLSCPKYSLTHNAHIYSIEVTRDGETRVVNRTPPLPAERDPQGIAAYKNELKEIGHIPNIPRPTNLFISKNRLYVTAVGGYKMLGQGLYVYEKNDANAWVQVRRYDYGTLFHTAALTDGFETWPELAPLAVTVVDHVAYVSNMQSSSIALIDVSKPPESAYIGGVHGPNSRLFYPLGIAAHEGALLVVDHLYAFGIMLPLPTAGGDVVPSDILQFAQARAHAFRRPYNILSTNHYLFVTSEQGNLYMFNWNDDSTSTPKVIEIPDQPAMIAVAEVPDDTP